MKNQIDIVKDIADGMIGIGGIPNNEEFYAEFDMRVREALRIHDVVGRSEQLTCPRCNSTNILNPDKDNDAQCIECAFVWAG
jgi:hypothetical protein